MLINLRNALMAGKRLPYDAEVEYLESTGTQWINTGYMLSGPTTFKLSASFTPTSNERDFFGAHSANAQGATVCGCYRNFVFGYNYPHARIDGASLGSSEITTDIEYALSQSSRTLKVNGTTYSGNGATFPNLAVTLFRGNSNTAYYGQFKCYAFQIYDTNGTLVRDFIPVRKKTVGYLYDRVSGKLFGNAGTGDFALGQDVVPVEWIGDATNGFINTGIGGDKVSQFNLDISFSSIGSKEFFIGTSAGTHGFVQLTSAGQWKTEGGGVGSCVAGRTYHLTGTKNTEELVIDNQWTRALGNGTRSFFGYTANLALLRPGPTYNAFAPHGQIHYFDAYGLNGELLMKSFPVRVGTEGAMMDVLTRRIYRNQGTGAFGYGNDLKYPIPAA